MFARLILLAHLIKPLNTLFEYVANVLGRRYSLAVTPLFELKYSALLRMYVSIQECLASVKELPPLLQLINTCTH